jgi:hypothetical protein
MTRAVELAQVASLGVSEAFKNRIINGSMVLDQRNAGASVATSVSATTTYTLDRWSYFATPTSKFTIQQNAGSVTPPVGFVNYLGCTSTSAYSIAAGDLESINQRIEGYNIADLGWGTANAKTVTLSFWVYSSLTGTFGGALKNSAVNRSYPFTYTISSANTWEYETVTIVGDTTGTWLTTNGVGINLNFSLGTGSTYTTTAGAWAAGNYSSATGATSVVGTNGATFYITGVQLEVGSSATSFEYRPYGTELMLCQRYCYALVNSENATGDGGTLGWGYANSGNIGVGWNKFPVSMRTAPSLTTIASAGALEVAYWNGTVTTINSNTVTTNSGLTTRDTYILVYTSASFADGTGQNLRYATSPTSTLLFFSAEL